MNFKNTNQIYRNIIINITAFLVQLVINLYISPSIVGKLGAAAYGFIGLATDFISYASVLASVLNSVGARFIADAYYREKYNEANGYFNSLCIANLGLSVFLFIIGILAVKYLEFIIIIPSNLVHDVKITFFFIFLSYIVTLVTLVFTTSAFIANRTDVQGYRNILNNVIKLIITGILIEFVSVKIYWVAVSTFIANIICALFNFKLTNILTPRLKFRLHYYAYKYIAILAKSGIWMTFTSISVILLRGVDLIIANKLLGDYEMGILSVARTMPNNLSLAVSTLASIFTPVFMATYIKNNKKKLEQDIIKSIKIMALVMYVPIAIIIVYAEEFYSLWQNSLSSSEVIVVSILSTITVIQIMFDCSTITMAQLSLVTNKLKIPVIISFICGLISILIEILLIKFTTMGIYSIVASSTFVLVIRYIIFNPIYAACIVGIPCKNLYKVLFRVWGIMPIVIISMIPIKIAIDLKGWLGLIIALIYSSLIGEGILVGLVFPEVIVNKLNNWKFERRKK